VAGRVVGARAGRAVLSSSSVSLPVSALAFEVYLGRLLGPGDGVGRADKLESESESDAMERGCLGARGSGRSGMSLLGAFGWGRSLYSLLACL